MLVVSRRVQSGRRCGFAPAVCAAVTGLLVGAVVVFLCPGVGVAGVVSSEVSSVDAPGWTTGPMITDVGLVWEGSAGVMLTDSTGESSVLAAPDAPNWDNAVDLAWFGWDWWVLARPSGVVGGRIGGALRELPLLQRCNPASPTAPVPLAAEPLYAVSGEDVYAALPQRCFARRGKPWTVVSIDLRTRRWRVLGGGLGTADSLAASGGYVALAYARSYSRPTAGDPSATTGSVFVRVWDAARGAPGNQIKLNSRAVPLTGSVVQVDGRGDVLISTGCCGTRQLAHVAQPAEFQEFWWARAGSPVAKEVQLGHDAVLSDGQVAFLSSEPSSPNVETIDVTDLLTGATRTIVSFPGTATASGLTLSGKVLAWEQQSWVQNESTDCEFVALSPPQLASIDLRGVPASPIPINGVPIPPQDEPTAGPGCPQPA
jgi:hypothetical protein